MHATRAPIGFFPVPEQNKHFFTGNSISTIPEELQTWQCDRGESNSKGSFPVPPQKAQVISFAMTG
jgi:hypothetical protein